MSIAPAEFIDDAMPWIFNAVDVDELEGMLINLLKTTPNDQLRRVVGIITRSVRKRPYKTGTMAWNMASPSKSRGDLQWSCRKRRGGRGYCFGNQGHL